MKKTETVIIGAGPYGLSLAAHLKAAGHSFLIFGTPLESWRSYMPDGMLLRSERFASNLWDAKRKFTFKRYCAEKGIAYQPFGKPLPLTLFLEYGDWFRRNAVGEVRDARVSNLRAAPGGGFVCELGGGDEVHCRHVVLATGHMSFRAVPPELEGLPESLLQHSAQIKDVKRYAGRDVTIIGAGQSALETAALVREAGAKVRLLVRKNQVSWNPPSTKMERTLIERIRKPEAGLGGGWTILGISELPRVFRAFFPAEKRHRFVEKSWGPSGAYWLRDRVEGQVEILTGHALKSAVEEAGRVRLEVKGPGGVRELVTDQVIAGTGFKIDLDRVSYLDPALRSRIAREGRAPELSSSFETSVPGLFIIGVASSPTFGPVMRFMFGAKHAAPIVARRLTGRFYRVAVARPRPLLFT